MQVTDKNLNTSYNVESPGPTTNYSVVNKPSSNYAIETVLVNSLYVIKRYLFWGSSSDLGTLKWESLTSKWDES
jgi:hypothetical protein